VTYLSCPAPVQETIRNFFPFRISLLIQGTVIDDAVGQPKQLHLYQEYQEYLAERPVVARFNNGESVTSLLSE
jgi:hypothetical protein